MSVYKKCAVPGCGARGYGFRFFRFPKVREARKMWLDILGMDNEHILNRNTSASMVCHAHFKPEDVGQVKLRKGTMPIDYKDIQLANLIAEVQMRDILWRTNNRSDTYTMESQWKEVANNVGVTKELAKSKWRKLQDKFFKELRRIPEAIKDNPREIENHYDGKWQHFSKLIFLLDLPAPKDTDGNSSESLGHIQSTTVGNELGEDAEFVEVKPDIDEIHINSVDTPYTWDSQDEKPDIDEIQINSIDTPYTWDSQDEKPDIDKIQVNSIDTPYTCDIQAAEKQFPTNEANIGQKRPRTDTVSSEFELRPLDIGSKEMPEEDENLLFLRSLLPYMQRLDPVQQLRVRTRFQEVLMQEMQQGQQGNFSSVAASSLHSTSTDVL